MKGLLIFAMLLIISFVSYSTDNVENKSREVLLSNSETPDQLVFIVRNQYKKDHHNTATIFQTGEVNTNSFEGGAALKILDIKTGNTTTILKSKNGVIRDPEVSFDGKKNHLFIPEKY